MEFKDLLSLAKDNQSFSQKKLVRDQLIKNKQKDKSKVSGSAVQSFLAKKQQLLEQQKAAQYAARKKRIEETLEASQTKASSSSKPSTFNSISSGKVNPKLEELRNQNLRHLKKPASSSHERKSKPKVTEPEKSEKSRPKDSRRTADKQSAAKMDFKELMKVAKNQIDEAPSKPAVINYKQQRRKKGSSELHFEWSGSSNAVESRKGDALSLKAEKQHAKEAERREMLEREPKSNGGKVGKIPKKAAAPAVNFRDLMDVAKQQAGKSAARKKDVASKQQVHADREQSSKKPVRAEQKARLMDINSIKTNLKDVSSEKQRRSTEQEKQRSSKCTLVTQTVKSQNNYSSVREGVASASRRQDSRDMNGNRNSGDRNVGSTMKRSKISTIDEELELERRELEKKRNILKRKMQGNPPQGGEASDFSEYSEDDYDDEEMTDFIDDGGEDLDYSKHIRNIFGYDRRRFRDEDDDVDGMEASYGQIRAEEARSARIAKLEDEIERRREDMEMRRPKKGRI